MRSHVRTTHRARLRWLTGAAALLHGAALAGPAVAQEVEYTGGLQTASGEYLFTERTTSFALLNGVTLGIGALRFSATLPVYYQNSTALTYVGGTPVPTGGPDALAVRQREPGQRVPMGPGGGRGSGPGRMLAPGTLALEGDTALALVASPGDYRVEMGDPMLQAGMELGQGFGILRSVHVHALAKVPIASAESGVGTGEWDYGAGLSVGLGGLRSFLLADASYWVVGDMPDLPLRNTLSYAVSAGRLLGSGRWSVFGSVMGATAMIADADAPLSLGLGLGYSSGANQGFTLGVSSGLTESAPDLTSYVGWRVGLKERAR